MNYDELLDFTQVPLDQYEAAMVHAAVRLRLQLGLEARGPGAERLRAVTQKVFERDRTGPFPMILQACLEVSRSLHPTEPVAALANASDTEMLVLMEEALRKLA